MYYFSSSSPPPLFFSFSISLLRVSNCIASSYPDTRSLFFLPDCYVVPLKFFDIRCSFFPHSLTNCNWRVTNDRPHAWQIGVIRIGGEKLRCGMSSGPRSLLTSRTETRERHKQCERGQEQRNQDRKGKGGSRIRPQTRARNSPPRLILANDPLVIATRQRTDRRGRLTLQFSSGGSRVWAQLAITFCPPWKR